MTKKATASAYTAIAPSNAPGGFKATTELDRLNEFHRMTFVLETALADRNAQVQGVRDAVSTFAPEYAYHASQLLEEVGRVESGVRSPREMEGVLEQKIAFFKQAASFAAHDVPRNLSEAQIHATELARRNKIEAERGGNRWRN